MNCWILILSFFSIGCQVSRVWILIMREALWYSGCLIWKAVKPKDTCPAIMFVVPSLSTSCVPQCGQDLGKWLEQVSQEERGMLGLSVEITLFFLHCSAELLGRGIWPSLVASACPWLGKYCMFEWIHIYKLIKIQFISLKFFFPPLPKKHNNKISQMVIEHGSSC